MIPDFNEVYNKLNESELVEVPPSRKEIISIIKAIQSKLFPNYFTVDETVTLEEIYLKISQQIKQIQTMPRSINFNQGGDTVDYHKRNLFIVNIEIPWTCCHEENKRTDSD